MRVVVFTYEWCALLSWGCQWWCTLKSRSSSLSNNLCAWWSNSWLDPSTWWRSDSSGLVGSLSIRPGREHLFNIGLSGRQQAFISLWVNSSPWVSGTHRSVSSAATAASPAESARGMVQRAAWDMRNCSLACITRSSLSFGILRTKKLQLSDKIRSTSWPATSVTVRF